MLGWRWLWPRVRLFSNHSPEKVLQARDVFGEIVLPVHQFQTAPAHLPGTGFVSQQLLDSGRKLGAVHPGNEIAVDAVAQPFPDPARVERDDGQPRAHALESDGAERLRPN